MILLITDKITSQCLSCIAKVLPVVPYCTDLQLDLCKPEMIFVESAWFGWLNRWKYKIASYPDHPERNNHTLLRLLEYARKKHIPTVFWDKEGLVHFDRFIDSARYFDHIFTVDADTIPRYKAVMGEKASVHLCPFAVNSRFHFFDGFHFKYNTSCFVGSYSRHIHASRRVWQEMMFHAALDSGLGLHIYDRNSKRKSNIYRYPAWCGNNMHPAVSNEKTATIYKNYLVSLNINTNETSSSMVSRRLVEILACGGIAVTTPAPSVDNEFSEYCYTVRNRDDAMALFERLKYGSSKEDLERARAGAEYVSLHHTWEHRLSFIYDIVGIK